MSCWTSANTFRSADTIPPFLSPLSVFELYHCLSDAGMTKHLSVTRVSGHIKVNIVQSSGTNPLLCIVGQALNGWMDGWK